MALTVATTPERQAAHGAIDVIPTGRALGAEVRGIDLKDLDAAAFARLIEAKFQWWVLLGYVAQIMFTMRFLVQWIASERAGKMVMPIAFWFFSIGGGVLLLFYALYIRDPVFILGQGFGVFVYARNLFFELRDRRRARATI